MMRANNIKLEIIETLRAAFPIVTTNIIFACTGFFCTVMIAHLGAPYLAASVIVSTIWMALSFSFCGVLSAVGVLVSHAFGANKPSEISRIMYQGYVLGFLLCALLVFITTNIPVLLRYFIYDDNVYDIARQYLFAQTWSLPGLILLTIYEQLLIGIGQSKLILKVSLFVVPIEIFFAYVFVYGLFGIPAFGLSGIGYGLAVTFNMSAIGMTLFLYKSKINTTFGLFNSRQFKKINFFYLKELAILGIPVGIMQTIEIGSFAISALLVAQYSTVMLAAHQIILQYLWAATIFIMAISQAITMRVAHAVGRGGSNHLSHVIKIGVVVSLFLVGCLIFFFEHYTDLLLKIDINTSKAENNPLLFHCHRLFGIAGILLFFESIRISGFGCLRGLKDTKYPMIISFCSFWLIGLSSAYILGHHFKMQLTGIWMGLGIGMFFGAIATLFRIRNILRIR